MGRMNFGRLVAAAAVVGTLSACGGVSSGSEPSSGVDGDAEFTLRYAFFAPATSFPGVQMEKWAEEVSERTDGRVAVELFAGGTLLGSGDIFDGVSEGIVDIGLDAPAYDTARFPFSSVMTNPVGFPNAQAASAAYLDLLEEYDPAEFEGYEIITAFTTEPAYIQTAEPMTSRDDLSGQQIRTTGAMVPMMQALGATPVGMPMPEVGQALQTGVVDGYVTSREVLQDFKFAEQVSYVTDYPLAISSTFVAVMDQDAFDALPEDIQDVITELRSEMSVFAAEYHDVDNVAGALEWAEAEEGLETVSLAEGEKEAWDQVSADQVDQWLTDHADAEFEAQEVLDRMLELRDEHAAK